MTLSGPTLEGAREGAGAERFHGDGRVGGEAAYLRQTPSPPLSTFLRQVGQPLDATGGIEVAGGELAFAGLPEPARRVRRMPTPGADYG